MPTRTTCLNLVLTTSSRSLSRSNLGSVISWIPPLDPILWIALPSNNIQVFPPQYNSLFFEPEAEWLDPATGPGVHSANTKTIGSIPHTNLLARCSNICASAGHRASSSYLAGNMPLGGQPSGPYSRRLTAPSWSWVSHLTSYAFLPTRSTALPLAASSGATSLLY